VRLRRWTWLALASAGLVAPPAGAIGWDRILNGYCQYVAPGNDDQPFTLSAPIAAGGSIHVGVVTSAAVTLVGVEDDAGSAYEPLVSGPAGDFAGTLLHGITAGPLAPDDSIRVLLQAGGAGGTSCLSGFVASGVAERAITVSTAGTSLTPYLSPTPQPVESLAHLLLFGEPVGADPVVTRNDPLVTLGGVCVGTGSGRLCHYDSYAIVGPGPFTASQVLSQPMGWGALLATFVPEPGATASALAALLPLAAFRLPSSRRQRRASAPRVRVVVWR
jgi:hypothetical protein